MSNLITFDPAAFRLQFAAFANDTTYPDAVLQGYFNMGTGFISNDKSYAIMAEPVQTQALYLMTAHLTVLAGKIAAGEGGTGAVTGATIGSVSVTMQAPADKSSFSFWLNQTPYGQQLLALLSMQAVGGFYVGGSPEIGGFRRVGGVFRPCR